MTIDTIIRSFRDPAGTVVCGGGRVVRRVRTEVFPDISAFLDTAGARGLISRANLVATRVTVPDQPDIKPAEAFVALEHDPVWFPSYAYEWPSEMLHAAALLTLEIAEVALHEGFLLKDANPSNILYEGASPIFVDICSFERRDPSGILWLACAQFERTFLLPLLAEKVVGLDPAELLRTRRDGVIPSDLFRWSSFFARLVPRFFALVTLPVILDRAFTGGLRTPLEQSPEKADWILHRLFKRLRKQLHGLKPVPKRSQWSSYTPDIRQFAEKEAWFAGVLERCAPATVLDVGCNNGHFSLTCARKGARVVAIDSDPAVAGSLWTTAHHEKLDILPLVIDFTSPSPRSGWRNSESFSFLDRCRANFEMVLLLAVIHHMIAAERIPFSEIFAVAAECTTRWLVAEFIAPSDPWFQKLILHREALFEHYTLDSFTAEAGRHFRIANHAVLPGETRHIFLMEKIGPE